jgi:chromosome partitioning protein
VRTFAIVNQKGGCGKTTTAINLSAVFARRGLRTLLVDMDPQSHCATGLGVPEQGIDRSIGDALLAAGSDQLDPSALVWEVAGNLDLIPSTMRLAGLEAPEGGLHQLPDRDRRLASLLERFVDQYDRCLIDCPTTIGLLTFNALRAAREAIIPVETGFFALRGADKQWRTIRQLIERIRRPIACHLVPSLYDADSSLATEILSALRRRFRGQVLPVVIHEHEVIREASSFGQPVIEYAPHSAAREDFEQLADWLEDHAPPPAVPVEVVAASHKQAAAAEPCPTAEVPPARAAGPSQGRAAELARRVRGLQSRWEDRAEPPAETRANGEPEAEAAAAPSLDPQRPALQPVTPGAGPPPPVAESGAPSYGVQPTGRGVRFAQPGDAQRRICVAGEFNRWSATATPLRYDPQVGAHHAIVEIPPGRYQYRLVIDGKWRADPYNAQKRLNDDNEPNSLLVVPSRRTTHDPTG